MMPPTMPLSPISSDKPPSGSGGRTIPASAKSPDKPASPSNDDKPPSPRSPARPPSPSRPAKPPSGRRITTPPPVPGKPPEPIVPPRPPSPPGPGTPPEPAAPPRAGAPPAAPPDPTVPPSPGAPPDDAETPPAPPLDGSPTAPPFELPAVPPVPCCTVKPPLSQAAAVSRTAAKTSCESDVFLMSNLRFRPAADTNERPRERRQLYRRSQATASMGRTWLTENRQPWQLPWSKKNCGEGEIRTPDTGFGPYNGLANRRLRPLGHLSKGC